MKKRNRIIQTGIGIIISDSKRHNLPHSVPNSDSVWVLDLNTDSHPDSNPILNPDLISVFIVFITKLTSNFNLSWGWC